MNPVGVVPASPDGFGSFESGLPEETVPSPGFAVDSTESDPWGSAWADARPQLEEDEPADEWERAKQEKAKQDRKVVRNITRLAHRVVTHSARSLPNYSLAF